MDRLTTGYNASMATLLPYRGVSPQLHVSVFLAEGARVIGDVAIDADSSVWFNTVVRGDVCPVRIGAKTNIQDNSTLHVTHDTGPLTIGNSVTVGHGAIVHACTVKDHVLIGMGAILLDGCVLEPYTMVAAGSVVRPGFKPPAGVLVAGVPAEVKRPLTEVEKQNIEESAENYARYAQNYRQGSSR